MGSKYVITACVRNADTKKMLEKVWQSPLKPCRRFAFYECFLVSNAFIFGFSVQCIWQHEGVWAACETSMTGENARPRLASLFPVSVPIRLISGIKRKQQSVSLHPKEYRRATPGKSGLGNPEERNHIRPTSRRLDWSVFASVGLSYLYTAALPTLSVAWRRIHGRAQDRC